MKFKEVYDYIVKIQSIAKIGLIYSKDSYAIENYEEINRISLEMLENLQEVKLDRNNYFERNLYPTPSVSTRTFVFNEKGEVLLVKEVATNDYSVPGGWCDLYDSPKESAIKEVRQEAGVDIEIDGLLGITERTPFKANKSIPEYMIAFYGHIVSPFYELGHETSEAKFFPLDKLPPLSSKVSLFELERFIKAYKEKRVIYD